MPPKNINPNNTAHRICNTNNGRQYMEKKDHGNGNGRDEAMLTRCCRCSLLKSANGKSKLMQFMMSWPHVHYLLILCFRELCPFCSCKRFGCRVGHAFNFIMSPDFRSAFSRGWSLSRFQTSCLTLVFDPPEPRTPVDVTDTCLT